MTEEITPIRVEVRPYKEGSAATEQAKSLQSALERDILPYLDRQKENAKRAIFLVELSRRIGSSGLGSASQAEDFLRAAVVLTHAYLEDVLRELGRAFLADSSSKNIDWLTFCTWDKIERHIKKLGLDIPENEDDLVEIQKMVHRRNDIVHRADRVRLPSSEIYTLQPIQAQEAEQWLLATQRFMILLTAKAVPKLLLARYQELQNPP